ncbi:hypothetical protein D9M68_819910 [compost metagenome]
MLGHLSLTQGLRLHLVETHRLNPRRQELQGADAVPPHSLQQVKGIRLGHVELAGHASTDGFTVGQQVAKEILDPLP